MRIKKSQLRSSVRKILLEMIGVDQSIGIGKNYHTLDPRPITWENYPGLEYSVSGSPDGHYYASVQVIDNPSMNTPTRKFADEESAMFWVRTEYERFRKKSLNSQ